MINLSGFEKVASEELKPTILGSAGSVALGFTPAATLSVPFSIQALKRLRSAERGFSLKDGHGDSSLRKNIRIFRSSKLKDADAKNLRNIMSPKTKLFKDTPLSIMGGGGSFLPDVEIAGGNQGVHLWKNEKSLFKKQKLTPMQMATLSHELGHSKNMSGKALWPYMVLRSLAGKSALLGSLGAAALGKEESARKAAIYGSILPGIVFAEENLATLRGLKGLSEFHGGGIKGLSKALFSGKAAALRMGALSGLSYGLVAATPYLTFKARQAIINRRKKKLERTKK